MDGLRWLLLLFGIMVIAGVYWFGRRQKNIDKEPNAASPRVEPQISGDSEAAELPPDGPDEEPPPVEEPVAEDVPQKIVTLRLVAREKSAFAGDDLILSLRGIGLRHGQFGIFHMNDGADENSTVFSAASLVEPGSFEMSNIKEQEIPGISLFMVVPGPIDGVDAFDKMVTAGRALAQSLDGELLDESGSSLSIQRERYLREEIIQFQHSRL